MQIGVWNSLGMGILNNMNRHTNASQKALLRLSSGYRINSAADDPAGLAISEKMRGQIRGLNMAAKNIQDGISLVQTAEGALNETHAIIQRMRELTIQAANDTNTDEDRQKLSLEFNELKKEIHRISTDTEFNQKKLLDGSHKDIGIIIHLGANSGQNMSLNIKDMGSGKKALNLDDWDITTQENADKAITGVNDALYNVSMERAQLGAYQSRLEHAYNINVNTAENLQDAESRIRDADMAKEMMNFTKASILQQVAQQALAMHMQQAQSVLKLLG